MNSRKWQYNSAGVYWFRTRRPGLLGRMPSVVWWPTLAVVTGVLVLLHQWPALLLVPLLNNRHTAYVGETMSVRSRRRDHLEGSVKFNQLPKPWTDLKPTWYYIPLPPFRWITLTAETLLICCLWPVYNHQKNLWNPRRIPLPWARRQRGQRDMYGWSFNVRYAHVVMWGIGLIIALQQGWLTWLTSKG